MTKLGVVAVANITKSRIVLATSIIVFIGIFLLVVTKRNQPNRNQIVLSHPWMFWTLADAYTESYVHFGSNSMYYYHYPTDEQWILYLNSIGGIETASLEFSPVEIGNNPYGLPTCFDDISSGYIIAYNQELYYLSKKFVVSKHISFREEFADYGIVDYFQCSNGMEYLSLLSYQEGELLILKLLSDNETPNFEEYLRVTANDEFRPLGEILCNDADAKPILISGEIDNVVFYSGEYNRDENQYSQFNFPQDSSISFGQRHHYISNYVSEWDTWEMIMLCRYINFSDSSLIWPDRTNGEITVCRIEQPPEGTLDRSLVRSSSFDNRRLDLKACKRLFRDLYQ